jgi:hypothetical protein
MMAYAFIQDVPADTSIYRQIVELLPAEAPPGMLVHVAIRTDSGLRYVDVWEDEAAWQRFRDDHVEPAVGRVLARHGIPHDHDAVPFEAIDVIDTWVGAPAATAAGRPTAEPALGGHDG